MDTITVTMAAHSTRAIRRALLAGGLLALRAEMGEAAVAALAAFRCIEEAARFLVLLRALPLNRLLRRPRVRTPVVPPVVRAVPCQGCPVSCPVGCLMSVSCRVSQVVIT